MSHIDPPPHSKRSAAHGFGQPMMPYVSCEKHRKNAYHSRKDARAVAKILRRRYGGSAHDAYPCDALEGKWHVGRGHRLNDARQEFGT